MVDKSVFALCLTLVFVVRVYWPLRYIYIYTWFDKKPYYGFVMVLFGTVFDGFLMVPNNVLLWFFYGFQQRVVMVFLCCQPSPPDLKFIDLRTLELLTRIWSAFLSQSLEIAPEVPRLLPRHVCFQ